MKKLTIFISMILVLTMLVSGCQCSSIFDSPEPITEETLDPNEPSTEESSEETTTAPTTTAPTGSSQGGLRPELANVDPSKVVALTFDDGPATNDPSSTERILDVLEKYNSKATFFVQGVNLTYAGFVERNSATVKREADLGMQIGSHSFDHPNFNKLTDAEIHEQIDKSIKLIKDATGGYDVHIVRTPGGAEKDNVKAAINMPILSWSIDTLDWKTKNPDNTYNEVMNNVQGGSIVLMHDIYAATADAVEKIVPALVNKGYVLVTIDELFQIRGAKLEPHTVYYRADMKK